MKEKYSLSVQQFNSVDTFEQTDKVGMPFVKLFSNLLFCTGGSISFCVKNCLWLGIDSS